MNVADEVISIFETRGNESYFGEPVSQAEHALQAAYLAEVEEASGELVAAALVHDLGHLLRGLAEDIAAAGIDTRHEELGQAWLAKHFPPAVCEPVRMHVAAKRYLCATQHAYFSQLSPASMESLALQGGPMSAEEARQFNKEPFFRDALRLRNWDDQAKIKSLKVPGFAHYRDLLSSIARK